jgi:1-acyl-sn-glycerol-3-phosphate acyltransferase
MSFHIEVPFLRLANRLKIAEYNGMPRTIIFFIYLSLSLSLSSPICLLIFILKTVRLEFLIREPLRLAVRGWAKSVIWACGVKVDSSGMENIPNEKALCFVGNHQGSLDIILVLACVPRTVGFVAKRQALYFPFLNLWIAALGSVFLDRANVRKALASIDKGAANIRKGRAMVIFPEGTRSKGPRMGKLRSGSLKLATKADATIVPFRIDGSYKVWEERGGRITPAKVSFSVKKPIPTKGLSSAERRSLIGKVAAAISPEGGAEL